MRTLISLFAPLLAMFMGACSTAPVKPLVEPGGFRRFALEDAPLISSAKSIRLGGFSGLVCEGALEDGRLSFLTITDRGPNRPPPKDAIGPATVFAMPEFQIELVRLTLDVKAHKFSVKERIPLKHADGRPVTGLPNFPASKPEQNLDETPYDEKGRRLEPDPMGLDTESLALSDDGSFWAGEEYRPSLVHITAQGVVDERVIPEGAAKSGLSGAGVERLPGEFARRRANRGFEGLARQGSRLYAFLQSALDHVPSPKATPDDLVVRVAEYNPRLKTATGVYLYLLDKRGEDRRIGDVAPVADGSFLVLEQTGAVGLAADKKVYHARIAGTTTNLLRREDLDFTDIDRLDPQQIQERGLRVIQKDLVVDLAKLGYDFAAKAEGLCALDRRTLAVINDNDFGLSDGAKSELVLIGLERDLY